MCLIRAQCASASHSIALHPSRSSAHRSGFWYVQLSGGTVTSLSAHFLVTYAGVLDLRPLNLRPKLVIFGRSLVQAKRTSSATWTSFAGRVNTPLITLLRSSQCLSFQVNNCV